ncbi:MAG TPA: hypothetical protein VL137_13750 [Polyangiaceae bacterium]|jgi:hypothetical protein|nr:hypothetical protein [Polyangiaceae bacterium]
MRVRHLSSTLAAWVLLSCGSRPAPQAQLIAAHYAPLCTPASDHSGSRTIEIRALGDFDPSNTTVAFLDEGAREQALQIPAQTAALELRSVGPDPVWGVATIQEDADTNALLLPALQACPLLIGDSASARLDQGTALGLVGPWLLAAGAAAASGTNARKAQLVDLNSGQNIPLGTTRMTRARAFATISAFGDSMLIAGGEDPAASTAHDDAEVFDLSSRHFSGNTSLIALSQPRTKHAALPLSADSVLLLGGAGSNGAALDSLEIVTAHGAEAADVSLMAPRIAPTALQLDDGRIAVAGGYTLEAGSESPVAVVEWFNAQASAALGSVALDPPALGRAFVATVGGGVLAVGGCDGNAAPVADVFWIDQKLNAAHLPDLPTEAQSCNAQLISASVGEPFLLSNGALWRFNPWSGQFTPSSIDLGVMQGSELHAALPIDAGLFSWLELGVDTSQLLALRHDTRNLYSADVTPFLLTDSSRLAPSAWASAEEYARYADDQRLELLGNAAVWITDTRYADFNLQLTVEQGPPPLLLLGDQAFGAGSCAWPQPAPRNGVYRVERVGEELRLFSNTVQRVCSLTGSERLAIGLRGRTSQSRIARLTVARERAP